MSSGSKAVKDHALLLLLLAATLCSSQGFAEQAYPQRIITLSPHLAELVISLDAGRRLVGVVEHSDFPQQAKMLPRVGSASGLDMERIITLDPDLVIAWQGGTRGVDISKLKRLGFRVVSIKSENIDDIPRSIELLGDLLGQQRKAVSLVSEFHHRIEKLSQDYSVLPKQSVFIEISSLPLMGLTDKHSLGSGLRLCKLDNIFHDIQQAALTTDIESVLDRSPAYILLRRSMSEDERLQRARFYQGKGFAKDKFLWLDDDMAFRQTPRILDAIEDVCEQLVDGG